MGRQLGLSPQRLEEHAELSEFGFDSLSLAGLARDLSAHFGLDIVPSVFFGHSTIEALAGYLERTWGELLQGFYAPPRGGA